MLRLESSGSVVRLLCFCVAACERITIHVTNSKQSTAPMGRSAQQHPPATNSPPRKEVNAWCRRKFGNDWWNVDKSIKKERQANARKALSNKPANLPESAVETFPNVETEKKNEPNPFKTTYLLRMRIRDDWNIETRTKLDPSTCIGPKATYEPTGKPEKNILLNYGGLYLLDTTDWDFGFDCEEEMDERGIHVYFGHHPFPYDGAEMLEGVKIGDTEDEIVQKVLNMKLKNDTLVIHNYIWFQLTPATREAVLRDSLAKEVYICDIEF